LEELPHEKATVISDAPQRSDAPAPSESAGQLRRHPAEPQSSTTAVFLCSCVAVSMLVGFALHLLRQQSSRTAALPVISDDGAANE